MRVGAQATGIAVAILMMVIVLVVGLYFLARMYDLAYVLTLAQARLAAKPRLEPAGANVTWSSSVSSPAGGPPYLELMVRNPGPTGVYVEAAYLLPPPGLSMKPMLVYDTPTELGVGHTLTVYVPVFSAIMMSTSDFRLWLALVTSKGTYVLTYGPLVANITVTVNVPTYFVSLNPNELPVVSVQCPQWGEVAALQTVSGQGEEYYTVATGTVTVPAFGGPCYVQAELDGLWYYVGVPGGFQLSATSAQQALGYTAYAQVTQGSVVDPVPGEDYAVVFRFPQFIPGSASQVSQPQAPSIPPSIPVPYDLDLSWLFYPYLYTQFNWIYAVEMAGSGYALNSYYTPSQQSLEYQIAKMGVIQAYSPDPNCTWWPQPTPSGSENTGAAEYLVNFTNSYVFYRQVTGTRQGYHRHPLPSKYLEEVMTFVSQDTGAEAIAVCSSPHSGEELFQVYVPIVVPSTGSWVAVPVFTVLNPGALNENPTYVTAQEVIAYGGGQSGLGSQSGVEVVSSDSDTDALSIEFAKAAPLPSSYSASATINGQTYYQYWLGVRVYSAGNYPNQEVAVMVVVSKVVLLPEDPSSSALASYYLPWAYVNLANNTVAPDASVILNIWPTSPVVLFRNYGSEAVGELQVSPWCDVTMTNSTAVGVPLRLLPFGACYDSGVPVAISAAAEGSVNGTAVLVPYVAPMEPAYGAVAYELGGLYTPSAQLLLEALRPMLLAAGRGDGLVYVTITLSGLEPDDWVLIPVQAVGGRPEVVSSLSYGFGYLYLDNFTYYTYNNTVWSGGLLAIAPAQQQITVTIGVPVNGTAYLGIGGVVVAPAAQGEVLGNSTVPVGLVVAANESGTLTVYASDGLKILSVNIPGPGTYVVPLTDYGPFSMWELVPDSELEPMAVVFTPSP